jgi:hypothetical protein
MAGGGLNALILFGLIVFVLSVLLLSAFLQSSVWLANKCVARPVGEELGESVAAPRQWGIPPPGIRRGMVIVVLALVLTFAFDSLAGVLVGQRRLGAGWQMRGDPATEIAIQALSLVAGFIVWCFLLVYGLPTSFNRAALVTLFLHVQVIVLTLAIAIPVAVLLVLAG